MYFHQGGMLGVVSHDRAKPQYIQLPLHVGNELLYPNNGATIRARAPDATRIIPSRLMNQRFPSSVMSWSLAAAVSPVIIQAGRVTAHVNQLGVAALPSTNRVSITIAAIRVPMMDDLLLLKIIW